MIGVLGSSLKAFIRFDLVRYSFAENTPLSDSPGMFMNIGSPAPDPMNTASKPMSKSSSTVRVFPMMTLVSMSTPRSLSPSTSRATMAFGSLNSGMP